MKKFLTILIVITLFNTNAYASCVKAGLNFNWSWINNKQYIEVKFKNTVNKHFWISKITLNTKSMETVKSKNTSIWIKPFQTVNANEGLLVGQRNQHVIGTGHLNTSIIDSVTIFCEETTNTEAKQWQKKLIKSQNEHFKSVGNDKSKFQFKWWYLIIIVVIIAFISALAKEKKSIKSKSKTKKDKVFYSEQYGWSFPGKYILFAIPAIAGLVYFDNGFLKIIFGIYLLGCVIGFFKGDK